VVTCEPSDYERRARFERRDTRHGGTEARRCFSHCLRVSVSPWHPSALVASFALVAMLATTAHAQPQPPELTQTVNDFAAVVDPEDERTLDSLIRALQRASGDVVVVATIDTVAPYADIEEYAVKMFENRGRGIGERGRDNGVLVLVAIKERKVRFEVGYELEQFITDGFAAQVSRDFMVPEFRRGDYGAGLAAGVSRAIQRIAEGRNVTLEGAPARPARRRGQGGLGFGTMFTLFIIFMVLRALGGGRRRRFGGWGGGGWSGWNSGVGPFGGGGFRGGGFGGGGFGGGFGGFGGGRSGGGGGGGSW
jgi:uncharacterized protein